MRLLVLGGTRFLGRHVVDAALERGHHATVFTRGKLPLPWRCGVEALRGDRDPRVAPGLDALAGGRRWDAVVDTSGYVPRVVAASADMLAPRVGRYLFVSSVSVYARTERAGLDETAPLASLADAGSEDVARHYGALKAACEAVVVERLGACATIVRPGLIVGPLDDSDRFGYWVARFLHPGLLGERADRAVVPAPPTRPLQLVDARDLAAWIVALLERDCPGTFNASSPAGRWSMGDLVGTLTRDAGAPRPAWVQDDVLIAHAVAPWVGLPLWLPASEPDAAGFMQIDCTRSQATGLATRALAHTIADTGQWLVARDNASAWKRVLGADMERRILAHLAARSAEASTQATFPHRQGPSVGRPPA